MQGQLQQKAKWKTKSLLKQAHPSSNTLMMVRTDRFMIIDSGFLMFVIRLERRCLVSSSVSFVFRKLQIDT